MVRTIKKGKGNLLALCPFTYLRPLINHIQPQTLLDSVLNPVLSSKFLYATSRVHKLLFARKKRVALGTDLHVDTLYRRTCLDDIPAGTGNRRRLILWMDALFHASPVSRLIT